MNPDDLDGIPAWGGYDISFIYSDATASTGTTTSLDNSPRKAAAGNAAATAPQDRQGSCSPSLSNPSLASLSSPWSMAAASNGRATRAAGNSSSSSSNRPTSLSISNSISTNHIGSHPHATRHGGTAVSNGLPLLSPPKAPARPAAAVPRAATALPATKAKEANKALSASAVTPPGGTFAPMPRLASTPNSATSRQAAAPAHQRTSANTSMTALSSGSQPMAPMNSVSGSPKSTTQARAPITLVALASSTVVSPPADARRARRSSYRRPSSGRTEAPSQEAAAMAATMPSNARESMPSSAPAASSSAPSTPATASVRGARHKNRNDEDRLSPVSRKIGGAAPPLSAGQVGNGSGPPMPPPNMPGCEGLVAAAAAPSGDGIAFAPMPAVTGRPPKTPFPVAPNAVFAMREAQQGTPAPPSRPTTAASTGVVGPYSFVQGHQSPERPADPDEDEGGSVAAGVEEQPVPDWLRVVNRDLMGSSATLLSREGDHGSGGDDHSLPLQPQHLEGSLMAIRGGRGGGYSRATHVTRTYSAASTVAESMYGGVEDEDANWLNPCARPRDGAYNVPVKHNTFRYADGPRAQPGGRAEEEEEEDGGSNGGSDSDSTGHEPQGYRQGDFQRYGRYVYGPPPFTNDARAPSPSSHSTHTAEGVSSTTMSPAPLGTAAYPPRGISPMGAVTDSGAAGASSMHASSNLGDADGFLSVKHAQHVMTPHSLRGSNLSASTGSRTAAGSRSGPVMAGAGGTGSGFTFTRTTANESESSSYHHPPHGTLLPLSACRQPVRSGSGSTPGTSEGEMVAPRRPNETNYFFNAALQQQQQQQQQQEQRRRQEEEASTWNKDNGVPMPGTFPGTMGRLAPSRAHHGSVPVMEAVSPTGASGAAEMRRLSTNGRASQPLPMPGVTAVDGSGKDIGGPVDAIHGSNNASSTATSGLSASHISGVSLPTETIFVRYGDAEV